MSVAFSAFKAGKKPGLLVEAYAIENSVPYFYAGQPAAAIRRARILILIGGCLAALVGLLVTASPHVLLAAPILVLLVAPYLFMMDWFETEYLVGPNDIIVKPGALVKEPTMEEPRNFNFVEIQQKGLQRRFNCVDIVFCTKVQDDNDKTVTRTLEKKLVMHDVPSPEAGVILEAMRNLNPADDAKEVAKHFQDMRRQIVDGIDA